MLRKELTVECLVTGTVSGQISMYKCTCATLLKWFHIELLIIFEKCGYSRRELDDFRQDLKAFSSFHSYVCSSLYRGTQPYNFIMCEITLFLSIFVALCLLAVSQAVELTFELPDNANQCFHEDVEKDVKIILEYQVNIFFVRKCSTLCIVCFFELHFFPKTGFLMQYLASVPSTKNSVCSKKIVVIFVFNFIDGFMFRVHLL